MGMTIDEHMEQLKKLKSFHNGSYGASINFALDTMRKYQKIQEQVELSEKENHKIDVARMIQIREFIYGNDT